MKFKTMQDVQAANRGWFEPETMRFFRTRVESALISGRYFISSEQFVDGRGERGPRLYTVREVDADGSIDTNGTFQGYATREAAREAIDALLPVKMTFPSIDEVARALRAINRDVTMSADDSEEGCDVRLQVYPDGQWAVRFGLSDYDQDHRGYWGSSSVPGNGKRFASRDVARDLLEQAKDQHATEGGE